ncbi:hypothetical protein C2G38_1763155 [Gigaspora rosea]|uniref:Uncharacterized protein n=1 Tax=Gigaspora rosea TaxID=44941 RepID=A0A397USA6_9GLOM|nr:hypothetical protein C2G38_1763155 [Gigaspora rosea]
MIKKTAIKPSDRFQRITNALTNVHKHSENNAMKSIGMVVGNELIKAISRVLEPPKITSTPKNKEIVPESGSWNVPKFIAPAKLHSWSVVWVDPDLNKPLVYLRNAQILKVVKNISPNDIVDHCFACGSRINNLFISSLSAVYY